MSAIIPSKQRPVGFDAKVADAKAAVRRIMDQHPDLSAAGWRHKLNDADFASERAKMADDKFDFAEQVVTASDYIASHRLGNNGSYGLKHSAERWGGDWGLESYVSNGAFIVAAILKGYDIKRNKHSPNCTFLWCGRPDWSRR